MGSSDEGTTARPLARRWIALVCVLVFAAVALIFFFFGYRGYRDWHASKAAPLFSDIEPADGATVYARDAWVRWTSPVAAKGRVLWRKAGGFRVNSADAGSGQELLSHLASLSADSKYEYIVEENDGSQILRSAVRTLNVKSGLAFDPVADQTVDHDYDQTVKLTLRNRGSQPITVSAKALKQYDDLPSDITGYGSVEVPAQIAPNSALDLRLAVTAADATSDTYEIPIVAAGAYINAKFHVRRPKLDLAFRVVDDDPRTLAKTVEIHNNGDTLSDLSIHVIKDNENDLTLEPSINHLRLSKQASTRITASPVLYLEFESLNAQIEAKAAGQSAKYSLDFKVPAGTHLIAFRSASITSTSTSDWYCTNKPSTCSVASGPSGKGPQPGAAEDPPSPEPGGCDLPRCNIADACASLQSIEQLIAKDVDSYSDQRPTFDAFATELGRLSRRLAVDLACRLDKNANPAMEQILEKIQRDQYFKSLASGSWEDVPTSADCAYSTPKADITPTAEAVARCADYHAIEDIERQADQLASLLGCSPPPSAPQSNSGACAAGTEPKSDDDNKALDQVKDGLKEAIKKVQEETDELDKAYPNPPIGSEAWQRIQAAKEKLDQLEKAWKFWKQIDSASCVPDDVLAWFRQVMQDPSQANCNNLCVATADWVSKMTQGSDFQRKVFTEACMNACGGLPHVPSQ